MENKEMNNDNVETVEQQMPSKPYSPIITNQEQQTPVVEEKTVTHNKPTSLFNGNEEVLFTQKDEEEKNPLVIVILFVALIGMIFILPLISKKIEYNVFKPEPSQPVVPGENPEEDGFYYFEKSSTRAKIGNLELTNFVRSHENNEYKLSFTLNNVGEKSYDFSKKYYIVIYEANKIVYRALIHSYDGVGALSATTLSLTINKYAYSDADRFRLEEIPTASYPKEKTTNMDGDYNVLTCSYNYNVIKYYFKDNELHKVYDEYQETRENNPLYEQHRNKYQSESDNYKKVEALSSTFIETETDFRLINEFELKNITDVTMSKLRTYRFFKYKENINIVSFEMEAQGYTCG